MLKWYIHYSFQYQSRGSRINSSQSVIFRIDNLSAQHEKWSAFIPIICLVWASIEGLMCYIDIYGSYKLMYFCIPLLLKFTTSGVNPSRLLVIFIIWWRVLFLIFGQIVRKVISSLILLTALILPVYHYVTLVTTLAKCTFFK